MLGGRRSRRSRTWRCPHSIGKRVGSPTGLTALGGGEGHSTAMGGVEVGGQARGYTDKQSDWNLMYLTRIG
jgi:hypothetical protein